MQVPGIGRLHRISHWFSLVMAGLLTSTEIEIGHAR
jgi:hypothetical protein